MTLTSIHVVISVIALITGAVVAAGLLAPRRLAGWTGGFLWSTGLTCVSGFLLPLSGITPAVATAVLGLVAIAVAAVASSRPDSARFWRGAFAVSVITAEYFNVLVLVAQAFKHIAPLHRLAPQGTEPPFAIAEVLVLIAFVGLGITATRRCLASPHIPGTAAAA